MDSTELGPMWTELKSFGGPSIGVRGIDFLQTGVRDNSRIKVFRCKSTGTIFLDRIEKVVAACNTKPLTELCYNEDNSRRDAESRQAFIHGDLVDVGAGTGGFVERVRGRTRSATLVEPDTSRVACKSANVYEAIEDLPDSSFDCATLFHVAEHMEKPVTELRNLRHKLKNQGKLIVEVPHANNSLIALHENYDFMDFTFWSEHLILHSTESLTNFVESAGFRNMKIKYVQRYPLANDLHWLAQGTVDHENKYKCLVNEWLDAAYSHVLAENRMTDTLWLEAER